MTCPHCPMAGQDVRCRGLDVPRFCQLIDPSCPQYDPGYIRVIESESHRVASEPDELARMDAAYKVSGTDSISTSCCGG